MDGVGLRAGAFLSRVRKEIADLTAAPPAGVHAWLRDDDDRVLLSVVETPTATGARPAPVCGSGVWLDIDIDGPPDTPYAAGVFRAECCLPRAFPLCPPHCRFVTPVLHPNIDCAGGRICVDLLKEGDAPGRWRPHYSLRMVLGALRQLLAEPNPDDPLDAAAAADFLRSRAQFDRSARALTALHAVRLPTAADVSGVSESLSVAVAAPSPEPVPPAAILPAVLPTEPHTSDIVEATSPRCPAKRMPPGDDVEDVAPRPKQPTQSLQNAGSTSSEVVANTKPSGFAFRTRFSRNPVLRRF